MKPSSLIILFFGLLLSSWQTPVCAETQPDASPQQPEQKCDPASTDCPETNATETGPAKPADDSMFAFLDAPQETLSYGLKEMAMAMDEFFAEERVFYDKTGSYVRLTADAVHEEGIGFSYAGDVKVKLRLPRTEKKLKLTFESNPEQQRDSIDRDLEESPSQAAQSKEYFAGIQTTLGDEEKWRLKPAIGFKFSFPIDIFLRLRADRSYRTKYWLFRPSMTLYSFKEKGFGGDASFDLNYKINDDILFRSSTFMSYKEENDYFEPSQVFSVIQSLSERRAVAYQVGIYGVSEPTWLATEYLLQMRYRQNIHSNYLFMEVIPRLIYDRSNNFDSAMSVTLRLEMVFEG